MIRITRIDSREFKLSSRGMTRSETAKQQISRLPAEHCLLVALNLGQEYPKLRAFVFVRGDEDNMDVERVFRDLAPNPIVCVINNGLIDEVFPEEGPRIPRR